MLFSSSEFLFFFLPLVIVFFLIAQRVGRTAALLFGIAASLFFYAYYRPEYLSLLIHSVVINYYIGNLLRDNQSRALLICGLIGNLAVLGFYKYADFVVTNVNHLPGMEVAQPNIALPLAISFFTFQQVAYLVDCYKGTTVRDTFTRYSFFVTFFPQLIAGPIVKQQDVMEELNDGKLKITSNQFALGISIFILGLFKKVVIADQMASIADPVFMANARIGLDMTTAWMGAFAYTFQIYFDFSAYSDMAIGLGILFGLNFPLNFNSPYKAGSIIDFWRRWHITLSRFLREYLYIPLGGNKAGIFGRYGNLMLTMLLGGMWHGADWAFMLWGGLHGGFLILNHAYRNIFAQKMPQLAGQLAKWLGVPITFLIVLLAWVPFRANGTEFMSYYAAMFTGGFEVGNYREIVYSASSHLTWIMLLAAAAIAFLMPNVSEFMGYKELAAQKVGAIEETITGGFLLRWRQSPLWTIMIGLMLIISILFVLRGTPNAFIYFEF